MPEIKGKQCMRNLGDKMCVKNLGVQGVAEKSVKDKYPAEKDNLKNSIFLISNSAYKLLNYHNNITEIVSSSTYLHVT